MTYQLCRNYRRYPPRGVIDTSAPVVGYRLYAGSAAREELHASFIHATDLPAGTNVVCALARMVIAMYKYNRPTRATCAGPKRPIALELPTAIDTAVVEAALPASRSTHDDR